MITLFANNKNPTGLKQCIQIIILHCIWWKHNFNTENGRLESGCKCDLFYLESGNFSSPCLNIETIETKLMTKICLIFRTNNLVLSSLITYNQICNTSNTMGAICGAGTACPSEAPEFTFSICHCILCPSSNYDFWLPLWYLQTFHIPPFGGLAIVFCICVLYIESWSPLHSKIITVGIIVYKMSCKRGMFYFMVGKHLFLWIMFKVLQLFFHI